MTVIAIDFGTSNTAIAILEVDGDIINAKTLHFGDISHGFETNGEKAWLVPSLVYVVDSDQGNSKFLFGEQVRSQDQLKALSKNKSKRLFQGFKRDIVASFRAPAREIDGKLYDAEAIAEIFLIELWQRLALQHIQPTQIIFTVPVGAFEAYLNWFRDFAERLKLPNYQIIDESTAAALGYAITRPNALVLVIDFGGGTLDLSLVRTAPIANQSANNQVTKAEAIAKSDAYIGGIDIDRWIAEHFLRQLGITRSQISDIDWLNILGIAEQIKIKLSFVQAVSEIWLDETMISHELRLSQDQLTEILEQNQILEQLREAIDEVLTIGLNRGISKSAIEQILLVGGSCQIAAVQQLIVSYFGKSKVKFGKPFEAVAHGALVLGQAIEIEDYLRHSYAIRLWEPYLHQYSFYTLFEKGTKYPCQRPEPLILQVAIAGQTEIWLDIGEVADMSQAEVTYDSSGRMTSSQLLKQSDFRSLAANSKSNIDQVCIAQLNPSGQLGNDRITINFEIDDRRVLMATVIDLLTSQVLINRHAIAKLE